MFGPHLILEGYGGNPIKLGDVGGMYDLLDAFPARIHMTKIMPPHVQKHLDAPNPLWGVSGFVMIAESHIALHTFPENGFVSLDIFSCKDFKIECAVGIVVEEFGLEHYEKKVLCRGRHYPRDIQDTSKIIESDRSKTPALAR